MRDRGRRVLRVPCRRSRVSKSEIETAWMKKGRKEGMVVVRGE